MHKSRTTLHLILLAALLAGGLTACGDDKSSSTGSGNDGGTAASTNTGESTSKKVTAADGGEVALKDAGVKLNIPAGALGKDETITAKVVATKGLPDTSNVVGNAIEFGPSGLKFVKPATLSIDLGTAKVPDGAAVSIAWLDEDKNEWVDLEGSTLKDGTVSADTMHFTIFAIRIVVNDAGVGEQVGGACGADFKACGGDLSGVWNIVSGCADVPASVSAQFAAACKGASFELGIDITGDVTFTDGKITGTLDVMQESTQTMPKSCTAGQCDGAGKDAGDGETITDDGTNCIDKKTSSDSNEVDGTYKIDDKTVTITNTKDTAADGGVKPPQVDDYCVTGDTVIVQSIEASGVKVQWTAKRKK